MVEVTITRLMEGGRCVASCFYCMVHVGWWMVVVGEGEFSSHFVTWYAFQLMGRRALTKGHVLEFFAVSDPVPPDPTVNVPVPPDPTVNAPALPVP